MSEVTPDVNPSPDSSNGGTTSQSDASLSAGQESQAVPYDRFKQVNDKAKQAEHQVQNLMQRDAQWAARDQALQQQLQQVQNRSAPVDQSEQDRKIPDATEKLIRQQLGNDEAGTQAYETLETHFDHKFKQKAGDFATKQEIAAVASQIKGEIMGELNSTFSTSNRFSDWVQKGMITPEQSGHLQARLNQDLQQYPELAKRPRDVAARTKELLVDAMEAGELKPFSQPRRRNPLVATPNGQAPLQEVPAFDPAATRFDRLRTITADTAKKLDALSMSRHNGANDG
jgi:hypothetical protein